MITPTKKCTHHSLMIDELYFGNRGYMAPEYLVRGQLTEKADVYSFGVLVFEIVCGRKNIAFADDAGSLIHTVSLYHNFFPNALSLYMTRKRKINYFFLIWNQIWKLYKAKKLTEVVDRRLHDEFPVRDALKVLQIGLLCAQASPILRPSMNEVVHMLISKDCQVPIPNQPPFLSAKMEGSGGSSYNIDTNTLISSALTNSENDNSYNSTNSSSMPSYELSLIRK